MRGRRDTPFAFLGTRREVLLAISAIFRPHCEPLVARPGAVVVDVVRDKIRGRRAGVGRHAKAPRCCCVDDRSSQRKGTFMKSKTAMLSAILLLGSVMGCGGDDSGGSGGGGGSGGSTSTGGNGGSSTSNE